MKKIVMIAGPNGAGKTTISSALMKNEKETYEEFLNADEIARGLAPGRPESVSLQAGKLMIQRLKILLAALKDAKIWKEMERLSNVQIY